MKTKINFKQSITAGLFAGITAAIINVLLFLLFRAAGVLTDTIEIQPGQPLSAAPVLISSIMPSIIGSIVFFIIEKFSNNGHKIFSILTLVLVLLSFMNPFLMIPNVPVLYGIILNVMHVVVGVSLLYFIKKAISKVN
jgi:hypothetical protein